MRLIISVTRISEALKRIRQSAGITAHSSPPSAPSRSIAGQIHHPAACGYQTGIEEAKIAPRMNWPSAPMLMTLARKPMARPCAMSRSGPTFRRTSEKEGQDMKGSISMA